MLSGTLQICHLNKTHMPTLVKKLFTPVLLQADIISLPHEDATWFTDVWLTQLWLYIGRHFPDNIEIFSSLPILPLHTDFNNVVPLEQDNKVVLKSAVGYTLSDEVCNLLGNLGIHVAIELPAVVQQHPQIVAQYAKLPLPEDVLDAVVVIAKQLGGKTFVERFRDVSSDDEKRQFREFISSCSVSDVMHKNLLMNIPVFETIKASKSQEDGDKVVKFVSAKQGAEAAENLSLACDIPIPKDIICLCDDASRSLAKKLQLKIYKEGEILVKVILPPICNGSYPYEKLTDIMRLVLEKLPLYLNESPSAKDDFGALCFIKTTKGTLGCPESLYDPNDTIIGGLFQGEAVFPTGIYTEPAMINILKQLGLRDAKRIHALDIFQSALRLQGLSCNPDDTELARAKSLAMLEYLERNSSDFDVEVEGTLLRDWLLDVHWVAAMNTKPDLYPETLPLFKGPLSLQQPGDMKLNDHVFISGSVCPVTVKPFSLKVVQSLNMDSPPSVCDVVKHLKNVTECYTDQEKAKYLTVITAVYDKLLQLLHEGHHIMDTLKECDLEKWIWNGEGFSSVESVIISTKSIDLKPYVYVLPPEMMPYEDLFLTCGVQSEIDESKYIDILMKIKTKYDFWDAGRKYEESDLQIAISILNKFKAMYPDGIMDDVRDRLFLPVQSKDSGVLRLLPLPECTYCDADWLRQGFDLMQFDEDDGLIFIHSDIPLATAECLAVPSLMSRMLHAEELNISGFGQAEPLTTRLKRLVEEYPDGTAIFKELIQNADDAGATEVKFLYDERHNNSHMTFLIDEGMKHCQGPALWCYNNTIFTDTDFDNITKLGGATKEKITGKIGKFGLGFNSVYNITDVPSFVSRESIVIFDPHTTHLGRGIRNKGKPGIKIDLKKNKTLIKKLPDQFYPYQGVFGINISEDSRQNYFDGTLFRIPLRTQFGASNSDISDTYYDHNEMVKLLTMFEQKAHDLILFTQNVQKITIMHLQNESETPNEATEIFSVRKELEQNLTETETRLLNQVTNTLKASAEYLKSITQSGQIVDISAAPKSSFILSTNVKGNLKCLERREASSQNGQNTLCQESTRFWLISFATGIGRSLSFSLEMSQQGLVPAAAIALQIEPTEDKQAFTVKNKDKSGAVFCFLPLPLPEKSGLPVHVNGMFALQSNRRMLSIRTEDDKTSKRSDWNEALLEDATTLAYIQLLQSCAAILPANESIQLMDIWPSTKTIADEIKSLSLGFYKYVQSTQGVPLAVTDKGNVTLENSKILDSQFARVSNVATAVKQVCDILLPDIHIIDLPEGIKESFKNCGYGTIIANRTLHLFDFYLNLFFPNIETVEPAARDCLVNFALKLQQSELNRVLGITNSIPAAPDGSTLKKPSDLVHPEGACAALFDKSDGKMPHDESVLSSVNSLKLLSKIGLQKDFLCWKDIIERAESIKSLHKENPIKALDRAKLLLDAMKRTFEVETKEDLSIPRNILMEIEFLPVMAKPEHYPLKWKGSELTEMPYCSPGEIFPPSSALLVGCTKPVLSAAAFEKMQSSQHMLSFLGLQNKPVPPESGFIQFEHIMSLEKKMLQQPKFRIEAEKICYAVYEYFQMHCIEDKEFPEVLRTSYKDRCCIWMDDRFVYPDQVAMTFSYNCSPYLYGTSHNLRSRFNPLLKTLQVKQHFTSGDYIGTLKQLHEKGQGLPLEKKDQETSLKLVRLLNNSMSKEKVTVAELEEDFGIIYMPDTRGILKPSSELCYNDCAWVSENPQMNFTHPDITYQASSNLGVKTKREEALGKHSRGIPFGQKERLTNSLKRILASYPDNHDILFELIQNADDAKATTIHFIKDTRSHPNGRVFEKSWNPLQGPALCVYNDSPFTQADLEGIQNLGEGSKTMDPNKTGQYGTGFSTVYHLTDAPSLLTNGPELGETLCVFDPNCLYVPGASALMPGMRYDNLEILRHEFPDVFRGYLPDKYDIENSTMFRFPLRNSSMCRSSNISKKEVTPSVLQSILNSLSSELFDVLLFLNHIDSIVVAEIDSQSGDFASYYHVKVSISDEDAKNRQEFALYLKHMSQRLRAGLINVEAIPLKKFVYTLEICDNESRSEKWIVSQRVGFTDTATLPDSVHQACRKGDLNLMPRGGVACMLERRKHGRIQPEGSDGKVHCFLPLPVSSGLPVNLNGHFALGHENRRHLWTMEQGSAVHNEWNNFLCAEVIAPAYIDLLESMRMFGFKTTIEDSAATVTCARQMLDSFLQTYMGYFPSFSDLNQQWDPLVQSSYEFMMKNNVELLPSVQELQSYAREQQEPTLSQKFKVKWLPSHGVDNKTAFVSKQSRVEAIESAIASKSFFGKLKGYFAGSTKSSTKTDSDIIKEVLLVCGINLLDIPDKVVESFARAGIPLRQLAPENVLAYLGELSTMDTGNPFEGLPLPLSQTPFKDEATLKVVVKYCQQDPDFINKLDNVPLAYCADGKLRMFTTGSPLYTTEHNDLVPQSGDQFLHRVIVEDVFQKSTPANNTVVKHFSTTSLGSLLENYLRKDVYYEPDGPVEWVKRPNSIPTEFWIKKFWTFVKAEAKETKDQGSNSEEFKDALDTSPSSDVDDACKSLSQGNQQLLEPLQKWAVLPCKTLKKNFFLPISQADTVLDLDTITVNFTLRGIMKKLCLPEVDKNAINSPNSYNMDILKPFLTTSEKPSQILTVLHKEYINNPESFKLTLSECEALLNYFNTNTDEISKKENAADMLGSLPVFKTIYGDIISITGCLVYTLPAKIPTDDMDVWQSKSGTVFLERNDDLQRLYDLLQCASITLTDVYSKFVLQHFDYLSQDARLKHLHYLYQKHLKEGAPEELPKEEKDQIVSVLSSMPLLEDKDGELQPASEFYDPNNELFQVMIPPEKFLPRADKYFRESDWLNFLGQLGLVKDVSSEQVLQFVNQVAEEGKQPSGATSALSKSKVLVQHLFALPHHSRADLLKQIQDVAFIAGEPVSEELKELHTQYGDWGAGPMPFIKFSGSVSKKFEKLVWTRASVLPRWADPLFTHGLSTMEQSEIMDILTIQKEPHLDTVVAHLELLCKNVACENLSVTETATMKQVFREIYKYLNGKDLDATDLKVKLKDVPCVLVDGGRKLIMAKQAVVNLYDEEEIHPYLYKLPADLGEFQSLFVYLGSTWIANIDQFGMIMEELYKEAGSDQLMPNELQIALKATKGIFSCVDRREATEAELDILYLPSENGALFNAADMVFNDAPAYYDRLKNFKKPFLCEPRDCGIKVYNFEEVLSKLPNKYRPHLLTSFVKDSLKSDMRKTATPGGFAQQIKMRLNSEILMKALARLIRHECYTSGQEVQGPELFSVIDRLQTVKVFGVDKVIMALENNGKRVPNSEKETSCFVEKYQEFGNEVWNIYVRKDASPTQDLLIKLADVINTILKGMLKKSVLYVIPLLTCDEDKIIETLDNFNIWTDHQAKSAKQSLLPASGAIVPENVRQMLYQKGPKRLKASYDVGDFVAYEGEESSEKMVYAIIRECLGEMEVGQNQGGNVYLVDIGNGKDGVIAKDSNLYQLKR